MSGQHRGSGRAAGLQDGRIAAGRGQGRGEYVAVTVAGPWAGQPGRQDNRTAAGRGTGSMGMTEYGDVTVTGPRTAMLGHGGK